MRKTKYAVTTFMLASGIFMTGFNSMAKEGDSSTEVSQAEAVSITAPATVGNKTNTTEDKEGTNSTDIETTDLGETADIAKENASQFEGKVIANVEGSLNIREEADVDSKRLGTLPAGGVGTILEEGDEWTKITSGDVTGYVNNAYILTGEEAEIYAEEHLEKQVVVKTETLKLREEESVESKCLDLLAQDSTFDVVEETEDWVEITADGDQGFVAKDYVAIEYEEKTAISEAEKLQAMERTVVSSGSKSSGEAQSQEAPTVIAESDGTGRSDICNYALQFVGNPYVWGGTSLTNGADCSGFVLSVFAEFGYSLPHSSAAQSGYGTEVSLDSLQPGDLLFYKGSDGGISHVTIYIGNGQVVHASSSTTGIKVSSVNYRTPCCARRIA